MKPIGWVISAERFYDFIIDDIVVSVLVTYNWMKVAEKDWPEFIAAEVNHLVESHKQAGRKA